MLIDVLTVTFCVMEGLEGFNKVLRKRLQRRHWRELTYDNKLLFMKLKVVL